MDDSADVLGIAKIKIVAPVSDLEKDLRKLDDAINKWGGKAHELLAGHLQSGIHRGFDKVHELQNWLVDSILPRGLSAEISSRVKELADNITNPLFDQLENKAAREAKAFTLKLARRVNDAAKGIAPTAMQGVMSG